MRRPRVRASLAIGGDRPSSTVLSRPILSPAGSSLGCGRRSRRRAARADVRSGCDRSGSHPRDVAIRNARRLMRKPATRASSESGPWRGGSQRQSVPRPVRHLPEAADRAFGSLIGAPIGVCAGRLSPPSLQKQCSRSFSACRWQAWCPTEQGLRVMLRARLSRRSRRLPVLTGVPRMLLQDRILVLNAFTLMA